MSSPYLRLLTTASLLLMLTGSVVRLAALASTPRTQAAISEDGYLMLTVARNIALGRSLTIAEGTIPTNGVQPFATFIWAGVHWIFGGARIPSLRGVIILEWLLAVVTALLVTRLATSVLRGRAAGAAEAKLAGALWFASPLTLRHTTNGLETGMYACGIAAVLVADQRWARSSWRPVILGVLLGWMFLLRNDAVFLIAAWLLLEIAGVMRDGPPQPVLRRCAAAVAAGLTSVVVASPWLIYNARTFGDVVPISGRAQNLDTPLGENLLTLPPVLFEYVAVVLPAPFRTSTWIAGAVVFLMLACVVGATAVVGRRAGVQSARWMLILAIDGLLLTTYYGLFFGAPYFVSRYLFPLSLVSVLVPVIWTASAAGRDLRGTAIGVPLVLALTLSEIAFSVRFVQTSAVQHHMPVVQWVNGYLPESAWVGAPQSGTLGYFHDRTINLDGKVNPLALRARRDDRLFHYIVEETPIQYIADWYGLARWIDRPDSVDEERDPSILARHFSVLLRDPANNLLVLRRTAGR